ncbi:MAG TPA: hypothetical protein QF753_21490 [Victivallales bacterium]|nr:hypothetical protein [Victivallales bacterium]
MAYQEKCGIGNTRKLIIHNVMLTKSFKEKELFYKNFSTHCRAEEVLYVLLTMDVMSKTALFPRGWIKGERIMPSA